MNSLVKDFLNQLENTPWEYPIMNKSSIKFQIEFIEELFDTEYLFKEQKLSNCEFTLCFMAINLWDDDETIENPINTFDDLPIEINGLFARDTRNNNSYLKIIGIPENIRSNPGEDFDHISFASSDQLLSYLNRIEEYDLKSALKEGIIDFKSKS